MSPSASGAAVPGTCRIASPTTRATTGAVTNTQKGVSGTRKRGPQAKPPHHIHHML
ncbi:MAG: hypothetical protein R2854_19240 [Caldilineaceae bacterium]